MRGYKPCWYGGLHGGVEACNAVSGADVIAALRPGEVDIDVADLEDRLLADIDKAFRKAWWS